MTITSLIKKSLLGSLYFILTSCGSTWYYCTLNSRGNSPLEKTYYVTSSDSAMNKTLEFKEYANILKERLREVGYVETQPQDAALCIRFDYGMGETFLANSTTTSSTFSSTYTNTNINSTTNAYVSLSTNVSTNNNRLNVNTTGYGNAVTNTTIGKRSNTVGTITSGTTNTYKMPLLVLIKASDEKSGEPIWEITVRDNLNRETQMQSVMPWLLLSIKEYIGRSTSGEQTVRIDNVKETREKYNLIWPY